MIFQDPRAHINPVRRIGDFMTEALRTNLGVQRAEANRRAVEMLDQVGITDGERRLRQYPHELSGGMLQRVMIAAALLTEPKLLLADEPTTALDVTTQAEVMAILDDLRREFGLAMLFITHDLELAAAICDRTAVMYAGQIVEIRESTLLHDDPLHPYTAALVGGPAGHRADGATGCGDTRPAALGVRGAGRRVRVRAPVPARRDVCRSEVAETGRAGRRAVPVRAGDRPARAARGLPAMLTAAEAGTGDR